MELKRRIDKAVFRITHLLIVPYGIETHNTPRPVPWTETLLIVPYGIETQNQETGQ